MADRRVVRARRLVAAVSAAWDRTTAYLVPRCRRVAAATRSGWGQTVAYLVPRCRRAVAATRSGWERTVAYLVPRCRRAVAATRSGWERTVASLAAGYRRTVEVARTAGDRASSAGHRLREPRGGLHRRSRAVDVRGRMSQLVKQRSEIDQAEYVALTDLLEKDERDRQYQ